MMATVRPTTIAGFPAYALQNPHLRALIVPRLGGRVWELHDRTRRRQWIWHREGVVLAAASPGDPYDDVWAGGWEELFPNDAPGAFEGKRLYDHGEWWTTGWTVVEARDGSEAILQLESDAPIHGARCTKEFRLSGGDAMLSVSYRIENLTPKAFHFLFKQHLPIALSASCRLALPGGSVTPVDPAFGTMLPGPGPFSWPMAGQHDLRIVPERAVATREFLYVRDAPDAWCGVDDLALGAALRLRYDASTFPYLWLFLSYGGWRDCYTAVLEPCTNMPKDLDTAVALGQCAELVVGGVFETAVTVTLEGLPDSG